MGNADFLVFRYTELELWRMFGCLARGMETMGLCAGGEEMCGAKGTMWWPWLHLDFKPDNSEFMSSDL